MILIKHELKQGWKSLAVWTASIGFFIIICVFLYPEMKGEMEDMNEMFSSMGAFSSAFGMDRLLRNRMWQYFRAGRCILCISYCSQQPCQRGERTHRRIFIRTPDQQKKDSHGKTDLCLVPASDIECDRVPVFRWIHFTDR